MTDTAPSPAKASVGRGLPATEPLARISELQLENARLRKLVTDLLLEKMRLEEEAQSRAPRIKVRDQSG